MKTPYDDVDELAELSAKEIYKEGYITALTKVLDLQQYDMELNDSVNCEDGTNHPTIEVIEGSDYIEVNDIQSLLNEAEK